jgi:hypothetical protein
MSCEGFIRNNRGINDGADLAPEFMTALYERCAGRRGAARRRVGRGRRSGSNDRACFGGGAAGRCELHGPFQHPLPLDSAAPLQYREQRNQNEGRGRPRGTRRRRRGRGWRAAAQQHAHDGAVEHRGRAAAARKRVWGRGVCVSPCLHSRKPQHSVQQAKGFENQTLDANLCNPQTSNEPSDEAIRGTLDSLHERAKGATFVVAKEPDTVGLLPGFWGGERVRYGTRCGCSDPWLCHHLPARHSQSPRHPTLPSINQPPGAPHAGADLGPPAGRLQPAVRGVRRPEVGARGAGPHTAWCASYLLEGVTVTPSGPASFCQPSPGQAVAELLLPQPCRAPSTPYHPPTHPPGCCPSA